ncbi:MFS transporter [Gordonia rhizosphera]|uniref:Putative major facilitator superfamily transporter n=1 Tax=Gordonia rhizosphera NBRC 16068 TaxID=1108045 RepID=K6X102_9ACTN|nr:MFS transporter [Gordonia rhizosphera]GAB92484.1 putative major facilitator superfamily transporter [Gordonia rhizosphera NBRC 16068]
MTKPDTVRHSPSEKDRQGSSISTSLHSWLILSTLFVFMIINFADKALMGIAAKPIMNDLGLSPSQYGWVASSFFFLFSISSLVVGFLTTKYPSKRILLVMAIVWTIAQGVIVSPLAGFWTLIVTRIVLGAGEGPAYGMANHVAMQWFPRTKSGIATAVIGVGVPMGTMLAAPIVGKLVAGIGWRESFGVLALASLVWAAVWFFIGREGPYSHSRRITVAGPVPDVRPVPYGPIIRSRTFLGLLIAGIASYWNVVLLIAWVPVYLTSTQGYETATVGWAVALPWAVQIASNLILVGWLGTALMSRGVSSRVARGVVSGIAVALSGVAMVAFVAAPSGPTKLILLAMAFGIGSCVFSASQSVIGDLVPSRQRGAVLGIYVAVYSLTGVFAPMIAGALVESADVVESGYDRIFLLSAALSLTAGLLCAVLVNPERDRATLNIRHERNSNVID